MSSSDGRRSSQEVPRDPRRSTQEAAVPLSSGSEPPRASSPSSAPAADPRRSSREAAPTGGPTRRISRELPAVEPLRGKRETSDAGVPLVRAAMIHSNLDELAALGPETKALVEVRLDPKMLAEIRDSSRLAWLPVAYDVLLSETIELVLGRTAMRAWSKQGMLRIAKSPTLEPILRSVNAVFGLTPRGYLRRAPQIWSVIYKDVGRPEPILPDDENRAELHVHDVPAEVLRSRAYVVALEGGIESAMTLASVEGRVRVDVLGTKLVFDCRW